MYLKSRLSNIPIQYTNSIYQKYNNKYMTPIHQNNLGTELFCLRFKGVQIRNAPYPCI